MNKELNENYTHINEENLYNNDLIGQFTTQNKNMLSELQNIFEQDEEIRGKIEKKVKIVQTTVKKENELKTALKELSDILSQNTNKRQKTYGTNEKNRKPFKI